MFLLHPRRQGVRREPCRPWRPSSARSGSSSPSRRWRISPAPFQANNDRLVIFGLLVVAPADRDHLLPHRRDFPHPSKGSPSRSAGSRSSAPRQLPSITSPIREISVLSKAIDTLDVAVKSFLGLRARWGLVTQLLQSEQKLELGGQQPLPHHLLPPISKLSRTLSEQVPSQEAAASGCRPYLELVTKTVNQELGTIDKFIGDGACDGFLGARPALLEDHAWRALRWRRCAIQRGMDALNERWRGGRGEAVQDPHRHPQRCRDGWAISAPRSA